MKKEIDIFREKIKEYKSRKEYYDHFVKLDNNKVMVISWSSYWSYDVFRLEEEA